MVFTSVCCQFVTVNRLKTDHLSNEQLRRTYCSRETKKQHASKAQLIRDIRHICSDCTTSIDALSGNVAEAWTDSNVHVKALAITHKDGPVLQTFIFSKSTTPGH